MASHASARRAVAAGYKDVAVMGDGIAGWYSMGRPVQKVSDAEAGGKSS